MMMKGLFILLRNRIRCNRLYLTCRESLVYRTVQVGCNCTSTLIAHALLPVLLDKLPVLLARTFAEGLSKLDHKEED